MMLHTKYQGSMPCRFRQDYFSSFLYISICKTCDPPESHFLAPRAYFEHLGRGPLGDVLYQTSRL